MVWEVTHKGSVYMEVAMMCCFLMFLRSSAMACLRLEKPSATSFATGTISPTITKIENLLMHDYEYIEASEAYFTRYLRHAHKRTTLS